MTADRDLDSLCMWLWFHSTRFDVDHVDSESVATIRYSIDIVVCMLNTADGASSDNQCTVDCRQRTLVV